MQRNDWQFSGYVFYLLDACNIITLQRCKIFSCLCKSEMCGLQQQFNSQYENITVEKSQLIFVPYWGGGGEGAADQLSRVTHQCLYFKNG